MEFSEPTAINRCRSTGHDDQATIRRVGKSRDATLDLAGVTRVDRSHLHTKHLRCAPYGSENGKLGRIGGIAQHSDPCTV
jgi:hypothetical protein